MRLINQDYQILTPLTRIIQHGDDIVLLNLANGKWVRIKSTTVECLQVRDPQQVYDKCLQSGVAAEDAEAFVETLLKYEFIRADMFASYPDTLVFMPQTAYLNVTKSCNLTCKSCYMESRHGLTHGMSNAQMKLVIHRLKKGDIRFLVIAGGEPLTRPGIEELFHFIRKQDFDDVTLLTNGTLITETSADLIAQSVDNVHLSLDGHNEEINAKIRGKGNFDKVITGISLLKKASTKRIRLITTLSSVNIRFRQEMRQLCDGLGVQLGTNIFAQVGRGANFAHLAPDIDEVIQFFREELVSLSCDATASEKNILNLNAGITCGSGTLMISVDCHGNIFPCHLFHQKKLKIGNLLDEEDLEEIMRRSPVAAEFRSRTVEERKCHGCSVEYFCKGGCLAHTVAAHGGIQKSWVERDPFCKVHYEVIGQQIWGKSKNGEKTF